MISYLAEKVGLTLTGAPEGWIEQLTKRLMEPCDDTIWELVELHRRLMDPEKPEAATIQDLGDLLITHYFPPARSNGRGASSRIGRRC